MHQYEGKPGGFKEDISMSEEKYSEFDKKMHLVEAFGIGLARIIFGIGLMVIWWNLLWATPVWLRIVTEIGIAFAYEWAFNQVCGWYVKRILVRISPMWRETVAEREWAEETIKSIGE